MHVYILRCFFFKKPLFYDVVSVQNVPDALEDLDNIPSYHSYLTYIVKTACINLIVIYCDSKSMDIGPVNNAFVEWNFTRVSQLDLRC